MSDEQEVIYTVRDSTTQTKRIGSVSV